MLLWNNKKESRTFILLDLKTQQIRFKESLPGPRVSCACQVEENVWLGCETVRISDEFDDSKLKLFKSLFPCVFLLQLTFTCFRFD